MYSFYENSLRIIFDYLSNALFHYIFEMMEIVMSKKKKNAWNYTVKSVGRSRYSSPKFIRD